MMQALRARDLMTPDPVTVPPETPVTAIVRLFAERGIAAVPVTDAEGRLRGIVTEADLVRRLAGEEDRPQGWFGGLFADPAAQADRYARTHGVNAEEVMTADVVTVGPDDTAAHIAHLMEEHGIRQVVVTEAGRLKGMVRRAELLRALVAPPAPATAPSDERIRAAVIEAMHREPWADPLYTLVEVRDGVVEFHGFRRSEAARRALRVLAENVPGVKGVVDSTQPRPMYV